MFKRATALVGRARAVFGLAGPVGRGEYLRVGAGLMAFKFLVEAAFFRIAGGEWYGPLEFFNPVLAGRTGGWPVRTEWWVLAYGMWTLPFIWIGIGMSCRRAFDAGWTPLTGLWFLAPGLNYVLMAALSVVPTRRPAGADLAGHIVNPGIARRTGEELPFISLMMAVVPGLLTGVAGMLVFVGLLHSYGAGLFVGLPLVMGVLTGYDLNRTVIRSGPATLGAAVVMIIVAEGALLVCALEGVFCLAMAFPILSGFAGIGAAIGRWVAILGLHTPAGLTAVVLLLPGFESVERVMLPGRNSEVVSRVEIDAPPERVWENVVTFAELPAPDEWYFKAGIAYPVRAVIDGRGVGAIRRCRFSTGDFVEPITAWEPGKRLAFGVLYQPAPMKELSPYEAVYAPHLDGYWQATAGEFRLVDLGQGRTRLEGSTWYRTRIQPAAYWDLWAQAIVHRIHLRVLRHIKAEAEAGR